MADSKIHIRKSLIERRESLDPQEVHRRSRSICNRLTASEIYQNACCIAGYVSMRNEVDTRDLLRIARTQRKRVGVPLVRPGRQLVFQEFTALEGLEPAGMGILEPPRDPGAEIPPEAFDLILVPGLAFDRTGGRIGFGGGYYDRYLPGTRALKASIVFDFQVSPDLPLAPHDVRVDVIVSESETIACTPLPGQHASGPGTR